MAPARVVGLAFLVMAMLTSDAGGTPSQCRAPAGATLVATSPTAVIYSRATGEPELNSSTRLWGCLRSRGELVRLRGGRSIEATFRKVPYRFTVNGAFAAYAYSTSSEGEGSTSILVYDLRTGRGRSVSTPGLGSGPIDRTGVSHLVITTRGFVAWREVRLAPAAPYEPVATVTVRDRRGVRTVDRGAPDAISGVGLSRGITAVWRNGTTPRRHALR